MWLGFFTQVWRVFFPTPLPSPAQCGVRLRNVSFLLKAISHGWIHCLERSRWGIRYRESWYRRAIGKSHLAKDVFPSSMSLGAECESMQGWTISKSQCHFQPTTVKRWLSLLQSICPFTGWRETTRPQGSHYQWLFLWYGISIPALSNMVGTSYW